MTREQELAYHLKEIIDICSKPLYNSLEVGFRHSELSIKEKNERLWDALKQIEEHAKEASYLAI